VSCLGERGCHPKMIHPLISGGTLFDPGDVVHYHRNTSTKDLNCLGLPELHKCLHQLKWAN